MPNVEQSSPDVRHKELAQFLAEGIKGDIKSISIIGSYLLDKTVRPGSDIDTVIVVSDLRSALADYGGKIFYKDTVIEDSQGKRQEMNVKFGGVPIDITILDPNSTNPPNNPLTDYYENFLGLCESGLSIYGQSLREALNYEERVKAYHAVREHRLSLVEEKLELTRRKIAEQDREDLHIIYELQRYVFIRECIRNRIFNRFSIKRPELSIPNFNEIFARELRQCALKLTIAKID